ncbi:MAG: hypothetical protein E6J45_08940 [Chloroflexi bacterium]|nr:MAG: hypothetical protein E6J45_08940 [Chloroflexota bacterium]
MRATSTGRTAGIVALVIGVTLAPSTVPAQGVDDLKQRIQELERSTREQVDALKKTIEAQEAQRVRDRQAQEQREQTMRALQEQVSRQQMTLQSQEAKMAEVSRSWADFFDRNAGAQQGQNEPPPLPGMDVSGNVYTGKDFKIRLGGSLRLHVQSNDTPVGQSVNSALLPNTAAPGGGNNGGRDTFRMFADRSRISLTMVGPETLGGATFARFEMDFNQTANGPGETSSTSPNPRLRWAMGTWAFPNFLTESNELIWNFGQGDAFDQLTPDTIDYNTLLGGLGDAERRNPRIEVIDRFPLAPGVKFLVSLGLERPLFDSQALGGTTDCGTGCLSGFPAISGGIGLETGRLGDGFGIGALRLAARTTWGRFEERFNQGTLTPNLNAQTNFTDRTFDNQTVAFSAALDRIGFNRDGRAMTLKLLGGGVWTRGEGRITNSEFDRRVILAGDGSLVPAQSLGGWINPQFFLTDTLSLRWAGGAQFALDADRPAVTGSLITDPSGSGKTFFRVNNFQSEVSLWWTPGPFTFALGYNFTRTLFKSVDFAGGSESRRNDNNKIEFISWWSF